MAFGEAAMHRVNGQFGCFWIKIFVPFEQWNQTFIPATRWHGYVTAWHN
jgi:hypothetical protein